MQASFASLGGGSSGVAPCPCLCVGAIQENLQGNTATPTTTTRPAGIKILQALP